jgi:ATP-dependent Clp protease ATP-binding subunit ClpB
VDAAEWQRVEDQVRGQLRQHFRPEFLNRVDDVIVFRQLSREDLGQIVDLQLAKLAAQLAAKGITLSLRPEARALLIEQGYDPVYGARPLKRVIQRLLQNPIALALLEGDYAEGDIVDVAREGDHLVLAHAAGVQARSA